MSSGSFYDKGGRLLTTSAFDFVLDLELTRAARSQTFLTLVAIAAHRDWEGALVPADEGTVQEVADIIGREVRDTDLIGHADEGTLALVLLDADFDQSIHVIDRIGARIQNYEFTTALHIAVSAACCPTDAVDRGTLKRQALARPIVNWHGGHTSSSAPAKP